MFIINPARDAAESNGSTAHEKKEQIDGKILLKVLTRLYEKVFEMARDVKPPFCTVFNYIHGFPFRRVTLSFCHLAEETPMT